MPILSSKGKTRFFGLFWGWKIGSFLRSVWPRFFAKQSEGDFYRLGEKIKIARNCLSRKFAAGHLLNIDCGRWGGWNVKNAQRAFLSVWGYVKDDSCRPGSAQPMFSTRAAALFSNRFSSAFFTKIRKAHLGVSQIFIFDTRALCEANARFHWLWTASAV